MGKPLPFGRVDLSQEHINGKIGNFADPIDMNVSGLCDHFDLDISTCWPNAS